MNFSEGTTVTTPFPVPGYGLVGADSSHSVQQLEARTKRRTGSKRFFKQRAAKRYYTNLQVCSAGLPLSPVIKSHIIREKSGSSPGDDDDQIEMAEAPDDFEWASLYTAFFVDAARAFARGDSTRPAGQASAILLWKHAAVTKWVDEKETCLTRLRKFPTSAPGWTTVATKGHGKSTPPKGDTPVIAECKVPVVGTPEWDALTERRAALIRKKNRVGLDEQEKAQFAELQRLSRLATAAAFPAGLGHLDSKLDAIEQRLGENGGDPKQ